MLLYEEATGAKVNFNKTKGLWVGKWKYRTNDPFQEIFLEKNRSVKWSFKNVEMLGVYVGNDNPALETFQKIAPEVKWRLHFWKPLRLPIISESDRNLPRFKTVVRCLILSHTPVTDVIILDHIGIRVFLYLLHILSVRPTSTQFVTCKNCLLLRCYRYDSSISIMHNSLLRTLQ